MSDRESEDGGGAPATKPYTARSVWLTSDELGLTAKIDLVEEDAAGGVIPIEYKRGSPPPIPEGAYLPERAQLCAQVLLLREYGYTCSQAAIYFAAAKARVPVVIDAALERATLTAAARARELAAAGSIPPPLVDSPKCNGCSLVGICLPDETNLVKAASPSPLGTAVTSIATAGSATPQPAPETKPASSRTRRLLSARDERQPLYVQAQGARIGLKADCLEVAHGRDEREEVRLPNTSQVVLLGNVQITTQAQRALLERGIPVSYCSYGGWFYGRTVGLDSKNVELRIAQTRAAIDTDVSLRLARRFVEAKIRNCRTLLRRNADHPQKTSLYELRHQARAASRARTAAELLGIEGSATRVYFGVFSTMIKASAETLRHFEMKGRNRRPPRDRVNALLSFVYALLTKECSLATSAAGLDPMLGFLHQPRFGRPSLALDLMEEFRPIVADSVVLSLLNNQVVTADDFVVAREAVALKPGGRKRLLMAYERRMDHMVTHPTFDYRITYRRVLEVQARLLGKYLLGEIPSYLPFMTR